MSKFEETILTKEIIDIICPEHDRTSCADHNLSNRFYAVKMEKDGRGVEYLSKDSYLPRCARCFLLDNIGSKISDLPIKVEMTISFNFK